MRYEKNVFKQKADVELVLRRGVRMGHLNDPLRLIPGGSPGISLTAEMQDVFKETK